MGKKDPDAKKIMIIRHGEEPDEDTGFPYGYTPRGRIDERSLTVRGWRRAMAIANLFGNPSSKDPRGIERPDHLFASGIGKKSKGKRMEQTLMPLAFRLGLKIDTEHLTTKKGIKGVAEEAMDSKGVVLICWKHKEIDNIAEIIMDGKKPKKWPHDRFDLIWIFDRDKKKGKRDKYDFREVPAMLLCGDSPFI